MNIAVCDDDQREQLEIAAYIAQYDRSLPVELYSSAGALLAAAAQRFYDIIFMDIEMQAPDGYTAAKQLMRQQDKPLIIFVTKSGDYTIRGYGVAFRYLRKPVSYETFSEVLDIALKTAQPKKLAVTEGGSTVILSVRDILYFEILGHQLMIHTRDHIYTSWNSLTQMTQKFSGGGFAQPHKSYLVNLAHIDHFDKKDLVLTDGAKIPISGRKKEGFLSAFEQYLRVH